MVQRSAEWDVGCRFCDGRTNQHWQASLKNKWNLQRGKKVKGYGDIQKYSGAERYLMLTCAYPDIGCKIRNFGFFKAEKMMTVKNHCL